MNNNSNLQAIESERLSSVVIDVESQITNSEEKIGELQIRLKGILKNPDNIEDNIKIDQKIFKLCFTLLALVLMVPIIFCDLYFSFTKNSCSNEEPDELTINLKLYLLVSGFVGILSLSIILILVNLIGKDKISNLGCIFMSCGIITLLFIIIFNVIWNILGAIVFWGYIYGNGNCSKSFSTYLFVSLIIKFVGILFSTSKLYKKNNDDK